MRYYDSKRRVDTPKAEGAQAGRHPRGSPEPVGSILCKYEPKRIHIMDLFRFSFDALKHLPCICTSFLAVFGAKEFAVFT